MLFLHTLTLLQPTVTKYIKVMENKPQEAYSLGGATGEEVVYIVY